MDRSLFRVVETLRVLGMLGERRDGESYRACFQRLAPAWLESEAAAADKHRRDRVRRLLESELRRHPRTEPSVD